MQLIEQLCNELPNVPQYFIPLKLLLEKAKELPLLRMNSEKIKCLDILPQYLDLLGMQYLIKNRQEIVLYHKLLGNIILLELYEEHSYCTATIILSLLTSTPEINAITKEMLTSALEISYLPSTIALLLSDANENLYKILLKIAIELSLLSPKLCK